jgi:predicted transcriptional regulator
MSNSDFETNQETSHGGAGLSGDVDPNLTAGIDIDPESGFDSQGHPKATLAGDQQQLTDAASAASSGTGGSSGASSGSSAGSATVADCMRGALVTAAPTASLFEVSSLMRDEDVGTVLIMEQDDVFGIVTDRDIVIRALADSRGAETAVSEIASTEVQTIDSQSSIEEARSLMGDQAIRRLVVVEGSSPIGVISLGDLSQSPADVDQAYAEIAQAPADK